ncbi:MAG: hypothetical protein IH978_09315 [Nitrospinae bacterium]|nr:hypothetical protein [Nitrospinota bacterium]
MLKKAASLRQGYGRQASGVLIARRAQRTPVYASPSSLLAALLDLAPPKRLRAGERPLRKDSGHAF